MQITNEFKHWTNLCIYLHIPRCVCPLGFYGRQCEKETEVPATDLTPPKPVEPLEPIDGSSGSSSAKPEATDVSSATESTSPSSEETAEPLGPIVITDPPTDEEPPQTAGKWPTEPPTDSPLQQLDAENET